MEKEKQHKIRPLNITKEEVLKLKKNWEKEFNLSKKIRIYYIELCRLKALPDISEIFAEIYNQNKEFIKLLKDEITHLLDNEEDIGGLKSRAICDKLAGEKLI